MRAKVNRFERTIFILKVYSFFKETFLLNDQKD